MSNSNQFPICLYHTQANQPQRYIRQIIRITPKTTCRDVLNQYISDPDTARLIETCFGFEREISGNDFLVDLILRNQTVEDFRIVVRRTYDHHYLQSQQHRRRTTMRSPSVNNNQPSPLQTNSNKQLHEFEGNIQLSDLQEMSIRQQQQIEHNQQLLLSREQRLKTLKQQEQFRLKHFKQHLDQQKIKHLRLKTLEHQIKQQRTSNSTFENELEILKEIFFNKEHELTLSLTKVDELTKQLDQLRIFQRTTNEEQSQNRNELDKLKQELMIRNKLNEQQNRKISYQRELFAEKQTELKQLDQRIEELQRRLKRKKTPQPTTTVSRTESSNGFRTGLETVQSTLNNINIAEIEKRMMQLATSFNSINTKGATNQQEQTNNPNSSKKIHGASSSIPSSKIAFASKSEIAATYMARSSPPANLPVIIPELRSSSFKTEEQLLPANLRLNDDILSVHFNNVTSNVKKRHSLSDSCDTLSKYLATLTTIEQPPQLVEVQDDFSAHSKVSATEYENLFDAQSNLNNHNQFNPDDDDDDEDEEPKAIIESFISDTESEDSFAEDIETATMFPITTPTDLKSLLKTPLTPKNTSRRVVFDPLALLLDAAVIGELELVIKSAKQVKNISEPNDEGLTALHNAVCASNFDCMKFLVEFGCDINYADNDGWTPLHCAASCNHISIVAFLIEHGACVYATTTRDNETAAEKCEEEEENYTSCLEYLLDIQNDLGVINDGLVYALYDYQPKGLADDGDELEFQVGDILKILRREDENESEWWWAKHQNTAKEGYVPRNYLGLYSRVRTESMVLASD